MIRYRNIERKGEFQMFFCNEAFYNFRATFLARSAGAWSGENGGVLRWIRERLLSKLYTYIFVLSNLTMWRGGWGVLDMFMSTVIPDPDDPHRLVETERLSL